MNTLLALSKKGKLLKSPLRETYLDDINSIYSASFGQKHIILGYDSQLEGFKYLPIDKLIISERYMLVDPLVDFDIFENDDFRHENQIFSFVAPRLSSVAVPHRYDTIACNKLCTDGLVNVHSLGQIQTIYTKHDLSNLVIGDILYNSPTLQNPNFNLNPNVNFYSFSNVILEVDNINAVIVGISHIGDSCA